MPATWANRKQEKIIDDYNIDTTLGEVFGPQVKSFVSPILSIRRSQVVELLSHLIIFLPTRPPKVDSELTFQAE